MGIAEDLILIIIFGLITGVIAHKIKMPPIIGYIIAGIIIGPYTGGITVSDIPRIELLAEIGVALLLFSIGLDFSFKELKAVKGIALIGTPVQILLLIGVGLGIGYFLKLSFNESLVFGMVISLSSTMVVLKILMSRGLIGTLSSKVMIGILIVQDLAAIPLMLIIPKLQSLNGSFVPISLTIGKAILILLVIIFVGVRIIPWILKFVAKLNSRELFLISITAIGLGVGYLTYLFGLSFAFGAFVAGMVINESDYSHQALNDIIPLRDIFGLVFFTSIGMLLNPSFIWENISLIMILVGLVIGAKIVVFSSLSMTFKYFNIIPLALGLGLCQIGEFSFVLARTGLQSSIISAEFFSLILSVSVMTMIISPFLSLLVVPLYSLKRAFIPHEQVQTVNIPDSGLNDHVIIIGGGRVGFQIASIFNTIHISFIIIEQDFRRFEQSKLAGFPVIYGDAAQETVLVASHLDRARLIINTAPLISAAREISAIALRHNPKAKIIARADNLAHVHELYKMNMYEVVQPEFEASLEIIRQALLLLDFPLIEIYECTDAIRRQNYSHINDDGVQNALSVHLKKAPFLLEMSWFEILPDTPIKGTSIAQTAIRSKTGVSIVGVLRKNVFTPNPDAQFVFDSGDYIAIIGLPENKKQFHAMML